MTLKSFDCSIPPIKLEIGCLFKTTPNSSGGAWYSTLRIAFTHLCLTAGPTDELNILYRAENIPHVYEEANSVSSRNTTSRSSLPATLASSVFETVVFVSLPLGHRWICLEVPVSSFVYKERMHLLLWFKMVIEMSGVQFGLKSYAWFQNRTNAQHQFDLKSQAWFQTKIARQEVQLPLYYSHFEIDEFGQYQNYMDLVSSLFKRRNEKAFTSNFVFKREMMQYRAKMVRFRAEMKRFRTNVF